MLTHSQSDLVVNFADLASSKENIPIRVLHVDDDSICLGISKSMLLDLNCSYEIDHACCVEEALSKLATGQYDVVVSDYEMPQKDGIQFIEVLRALKNEIPFIIFTGKSREEVAIKALNLGADAYHNKQGDPETVYGELSHSIKMAVDRKKSYQALQESEKRYRTLMEKASEAIFVHDGKGRIVDANQQACKKLGYIKEELKKMVIGDIDKDAGLNGKCDLFWPRAIEGESITFESNHRRKDGFVFPVEVSLGPITFDNETLLMCIVRDITERKKAEDELKKSHASLVESENNYRSLINGMNESAWVIDFEGNFIDVNRAAVEVLGYSKEELIALGIKDIDKYLSENQVKSSIGSLPKVESQVFETVHTTKDGKAIPMEISSSLIIYNGKEAILSIARNIIDRKKTEQILVESEARYRDLANSLPQVVFETDVDGNIIFVNNQASKITGLSLSETGHNFSFLQIVAVGEQEKALDVIKQLMAGENVGGVEFHLRRKDGSFVPILFFASPRVVQGKVAGIRGIVVDISERKKTEEEMKVFSSLFELASDAIFVNDLEGNLVYFNESAYKQRGYSREEMAKMNLFDLNAPETVDAIKPRIKSLLETGSGVFELVHLRKDKTRMFLEVNSRVIDANGKKLILSIDRDITERKQLEVEQQNSEAKLRAVLDATPFPVALVDTKDDKIFFWSCSALKLFGHVAPTAKQWYEIAYPDPAYRQDVINQWKPALEKARQTNQWVNTGEYNVTCHDGSVRVCELYATFLKDTLIVTFNDITERKQVEEKQKEIKKNYQFIFENNFDGIIVAKRDGTILSANPAICQMLGMTEQEVVKAGRQGIVVDEQRNYVALKEQDEKGKVIARLAFRRKDGSTFEAEISSTEFVDFYGSISLLVTVRDLSNRLMLEDKLRTIGGFTRHDIRNKLMSATGQVYLSKKLVEDHSEIEKRLVQLEATLNSIGRILDVSKEYELLGSQKLSLIDVGKSFDQSCELFSKLNGIKVVNRVGVYNVLADQLLTTLFYNLIDNTIKYGEKANRIEVYVQKNKDGSESIVYEDDGVGISPEDKLKLFEKGFGKGTGYGLFLIKKTCEIYGWTITEEGEPGKGAKFVILIPACNSNRIESLSNCPII